MVAPSPSASSIGGTRNTIPASIGSDIWTGSSGRLPNPMISNIMSGLS